VIADHDRPSRDRSEREGFSCSIRLIYVLGETLIRHAKYLVYSVRCAISARKEVFAENKSALGVNGMANNGSTGTGGN
jgi:hypothetical protein